MCFFANNVSIRRYLHPSSTGASLPGHLILLWNEITGKFASNFINMYHILQHLVLVFLSIFHIEQYSTLKSKGRQSDL